MAALTKDRNTLNKELGRAISVPLAANAIVFAGGMVSRKAADGFCIAGADTAATKVVGVADEGGDNTGGADGDVEVLVRKGVFGFANDGGTPVDQIDLGNEVFISDDQTVEKVAGVVNNIRAGTLDRLEDGQAFIKMDEHAV